MSTERTLAEYLRSIVGHLAAGEPSSMRRLREVTGTRVASLQLDDEVVEVWFGAGAEAPFHTRARKQPRTKVPSGRTDSGTVLALMRGELELSHAILAGLLDARGSVAEITAIATAIEIVIDASTRVPALVRLSWQFREQRADFPPVAATHRERLEAGPARQLELLARLGLLDH